MKKYFSLVLVFTISFLGHAQSGNPKGEPPAKSQSESVVKSKVKVFPNPATNLVNVLGLKNTPRADILITDIYGNTLITYQWAIRRNAVNIPISILDTGAYIIHIHSEEQQVRMKFYKQ